MKATHLPNWFFRRAKRTRAIPAETARQFSKLRIATMAVATALAATPSVKAQTIGNGGFESGSANVGPIPTNFGTWGGDGSAYVGTTFGISPFEGSRMMRFLTADQSLSSTSLIDSQYHQNIDLAAFSAAIAQGKEVFSASAMFNRVAGNAQTDTEFQLQITAKSGTPSSFTDLGSATSVLFSDSDPATWEKVSIDNFQLPLGTTFVTLEVVATENIFNNTSGTEYDGHFVDAVTVQATTVPEPGSALLLAVACSAFMARRQRSRVTR